MKTIKNIILLVILTLSISNGNSQTYKLSKKINVPGNGGWDYSAVDNVNQKLYVSHGDDVNIIDIKTDLTVATIPDTKGVHGIAIANDLNKAFITNGKDNSVTIIDLKTFVLLEKVAISGQKPDAILYDNFSKKVFTFNAKSNDATVLDAVTNKVVKTIPLNGKPEFSATNNKGLIYVNIENKNEIKTINTTKLEVTTTWSIAPGDEPSGLALDTQTNRLFAVCGNKLMIIVDAKSGKTITTLPIGEGCDGVVFDPKLKLAFASCGDGTITVIKEDKNDKFSVLETVKSQKGARTICLNPTTGSLYLTTSDFNAKPESTTENPKSRASIVLNTFKVLVFDPIGY